MIPENFDRLDLYEGTLRAESLKAIKNSEELTEHLKLIESSMNMIQHFVQNYKHKTEDQLTIQLLGVRLFNSSACALKLLLSGYYQNSVILQRDLLETIFLLDYFTIDNKHIDVWCKADRKQRIKDFSPALIRKALDDRDGYKLRKRDKAYHFLCELAAHPTNIGFQMLCSDGPENACLGPFYNFESLKATLGELAKHLIQIGVFNSFFSPEKKADHATKIGFIEIQGLWMQKFLNTPFDKKRIEEIKDMLSKRPE